MQAKNASDTAFVCSYGQGLSPALQPTRVSGHSLILPRAHPPGSSHSRLCPLPILFQPGRGLREPVKDAPSFLPGLQLVLLLLPSGLHSPKLPPSWLCSAGGLPAPNRDSTKSPLPSTRQLQVQFLNSPIPGCHHPNPGYYVKDLWLWLGADAPEKKYTLSPFTSPCPGALLFFIPQRAVCGNKSPGLSMERDQIPPAKAPGARWEWFHPSGRMK